jgi:hypothetical protein
MEDTELFQRAKKYERKKRKKEKIKISEKNVDSCEP